MSHPAKQAERTAPVIHRERTLDGEIKNPLPQNLDGFISRCKQWRVDSHKSYVSIKRTIDTTAIHRICHPQGRKRRMDWPCVTSRWNFKFICRN